MTAGLEAAGFAVLPSASTYFLCVDLAASGISLDDEAFATAAPFPSTTFPRIDPFSVCAGVTMVRTTNAVRVKRIDKKDERFIIDLQKFPDFFDLRAACVPQFGALSVTFSLYRVRSLLDQLERFFPDRDRDRYRQKVYHA